MWWFLWGLSYLIIGTVLTAWIASCAVRAGKFDPENPETIHLLGYPCIIVFWPLALCFVIVMGVAYAVKGTKKAEE